MDEEATSVLIFKGKEFQRNGKNGNRLSKQSIFKAAVAYFCLCNGEN